MTNEELKKLVEARGAAASKYYKGIDEIAAYIRDYVKKYQNDDVVTFMVPSSIVDNVPIISGAVILVNAYPIRNEAIEHSDGSFDIEDNGLITINCTYSPSDEGKVYFGTIFPSLYHEINHLHHWRKVGDDVYLKNANKALPISEEGNTVIDDIVYRLLSETEFNALIASVYGSLEAIKSKRDTYIDDLRKVKAYRVYMYLLTKYEKAIDELTDDDALRLKETFKSRGIKLKKSSNSVSSFKEVFKETVKGLLNELIHNIGRVATLYYENEDKREDEKLRKLLKGLGK